MVRVALITCRLLGLRYQRAEKVQSPSLFLSFTHNPFFPRPPRTLTDLAMAKFKLWQFLLSPLVNVKEVFPPRIPSPDASRFLFTLSRIRHGQGTDREIPVNRRGWQLVERMEIRRGPPTTPCVENSESWQTAVLRGHIQRKERENKKIGTVRG